MNSLTTFNPAELPPEALEALMEGYRRHLRGSLNAWCEHCLAPAGHTPALHHQLIIRELEDVAAGRTKRLMLFLPPGSAKSTYASVLFPPWFLARHRGLDLIAASHTVALAERFGRQARDMLAEHGPVLGAQLAGDNTAAGSWRLENTSRYYAIGTGGSLTGRRADCLPGNTIVQTISGPCRLDRVEVGTETGYVLAYDFRAEAPRYCRVSAVMRRRTNELWRIRTASGRVVEATGNHLVFTEKGWTPAASVVVGDVLLSAVWQDGSAEGLRGCKEGAQGRQALLQPGLLGQVDQCCAGRGSAADMQVVRGLVAKQASWSEDVLDGVLCGDLDQGADLALRFAPKTTAEIMRGVQGSVHAAHSSHAGTVLFPSVQGCRTLCGDGWLDESKLARWGEPKPASGRRGAEVPGGEASCDEAGRTILCDVWSGRGEAGRSPHRHGQHEQRSEQHRDPVPALSLEAAWRGSRDTAPDPVAVVERVCREEVVYDIEVEGTHNFFANGVLVHNCVVIDDPVADAEEADSETQREKLWDWYNSVLLTRLKPNGRIIIVMTRWHADDLAGRLLQVEPDTWRVLSMPALAEGDNDPLGRAPGEPLWDDGGYGYGGELLRKREAYAQAGASRVWSALYQQRPTLGEGSIFRADMIGTVDALPAGAQMVRAWDLAATKQAGSRDPDWTAGVLLVAADRRWVVADVVRIRGGPEEVERIILATAQRDGHSVKISIPQDPGQAGKSQIAYLTAKLAGWSVMSNPETGAKETRAAPIASQCNIGNLAVLRGSWNRAFIDELRDFPAGTHDDMVDALSRAFAMIGAGFYDASMSWI